MIIERYSKNHFKVQKRYSRGQKDDVKVQQKPALGLEEIQQKTE
jgi:hypothetical protein